MLTANALLLGLFLDNEVLDCLILFLIHLVELLIHFFDEIPPSFLEFNHGVCAARVYRFVALVLAECLDHSFGFDGKHWIIFNN